MKKKTTKTQTQTAKNIETPVQKNELSSESTEVTKKAPSLEEGLISVSFTPEELRNFLNLMSITARTFENLALQAAEQNDEKTYTVLSARYKLSNAYAVRLMQFAKVGEPTSRDFH